MILDGKPASAIEVGDLERLITGQVREGQQIDYKQALPDARDPRASTEFRLDIAAFANANGGYLIFGVEEEDLLPTRLDGLTGIDPDREIERLKALLLSDIAPRVPRVTMQAVLLPGGPWVIVIHVPRSWTRPHWVARDREWVRFVARSDAGKNTLDYRQARDLFLGSAAMAERIRGFRTERLAQVLAGETPVPLVPFPKVDLHVVPYDAFDVGSRLDVTALDDIRLYDALAPLGGSYNDRRPNFDGYLTFDGYRDGLAEKYLQVFRSGALETINAFMLQPSSDGNRLTPGRYLEDQLIKAVGDYLPLLQSQGSAPPYAVMVSLLGVRGYSMGFSRGPISARHYPLERDTYLFPEVLAEELAQDPALTLRPLFDALWNAIGWRASPHYDRKTGSRLPAS